MIDIHGHSNPHLHGPCPVCGYATRYKQFGPMRCLCNRYWTKEAQEAHRAWQEEGVWQAKQRVAEHERSQGTQ
jgi:hypothetical protein